MLKPGRDIPLCREGAPATPSRRTIRGVGGMNPRLKTDFTGTGCTPPGGTGLPAPSRKCPIGDPARFAHSRDVPAYLGLTPRRHQSGSIEQQLRISKAGNKQLRSLLVQCAQYLLGRFGPDSDLKRWGTRMFERGGKNSKKRAIVAVARKLAVLLHRLWVTGDTYHPLYNVFITSQSVPSRHDVLRRLQCCQYDKTVPKHLLMIMLRTRRA